MSYRDRMEQKLTLGLSPQTLEIKDISHLHAGHSGAHAAGETHFMVRIVAERFQGLSRVARQRLVYELVAEEMQERVHALQLKTQTPAEAAVAAAAAAV